MADTDNNFDIQDLIQRFNEATNANDVGAANSVLSQLAAAPQEPPPVQPPPTERDSVVAKTRAAQIAAGKAPSTPPPDLNLVPASPLPADIVAAPSGLAASPLVQGGTPSGQSTVPRPTVGGLPGLIWNLLSPEHRAQGTPQGQMVPTKLQSFESFLANFLQSMGQGMAAAHGPGAALKGASAAMQAPYQQALQQYQLQQGAQAQQAQIGDIQSQTELRRAQAAQMGQMVTFRDPVSGQPVTMPYGVAAKAFPQVFSAEAKKYTADTQAATKLTIAQMQEAIAQGKVARVEPHKNDSGVVDGMMAYNQFNQPLGMVPGAVPPASLFGNTKFTQNSDGSFSSVTTTPNMPATAAPGKPAPKTGAVTSPAGSATPQQNSSFVAKMDKSTNPIDVQARQVVNGDITLDDVDAKTKSQVDAKANSYSLAIGLGPFTPRTGGGADPFGVKVGTDSTGRVLSRKEIDSAQKVFNKDYVEPLNVLQKTAQEFKRIDENPNQTGAEKVTALLSAIGISGDPLKGKGFRISNSVIEEHAQARNIWETGIQKLNRIFGSGGPITSQQLSDYRSVAEGVVHDAFVTAGQEARRQGLAVDFLPRATAQNQLVDPLTAKIYLDVANGNKQAAYKALQAAGYR